MKVALTSLRKLDETPLPNYHEFNSVSVILCSTFSTFPTNSILQKLVFEEDEQPKRKEE
jgi:hypothetical protein